MRFDECIDQGFNGVVSITEKKENIFCKAFGYADLPNKVLNKIDTKFATASAGKVFIGTAILKLIEQNKLFFNSCIGDILTFDLKEIDPKITIQQLLNHTSGIPDYFDESIMTNYSDLWANYPNYKIRSSSDLIPLFINKPMMYPPGLKFQYNNTGFAVLGLIIEIITGMKFDDYLKKCIFIPSEMQNTGYYELDRLPENCANSYIFDSKRQEYYTNIYSVDVKGTGAGGAFTTVIDINKFWDSLIGCRLISMELLNTMLSPQVIEECYGYGIWLDKKSNNLFSFHFTGCDPGVSFFSAYDKQKDLIITLVSNFGDDVWRVFKKISEIINV